MKHLTHLSLFSGIGGLDLAAERAGFRTVGQCEFADYPYQVLCRHWPDVPKWRDICTLSGGDFYDRTGLRTVDVLSGGFPCQPFSVAGKRRGTEDDRYLWPEMLRVIKELRPAWVVGENVAGIVNMALDQVLSDLEAQNYETRAFVIPACGVDAPHRRDRVAIIAYNNAIRRSVRGSERERIYRDKTRNETDSGGSDVADAERIGLRENSNQSTYNEKRDGPAYGKKRKTKLCEAGCGSSDVSNPAGTGFQNRTSGAFFRPEEEQKPERSDWWPIEPDVGRVAHGIPHRVDRLKCLGNAVVPAQFYPIFNGIAQAESLEKEAQK